MKNKYTRQQREYAILICDIAASSRENSPWYGQISLDLGLKDGHGSVDPPELELAFAAWDHIMTTIGSSEWSRAIDAESAQILREGWVPA